jgi:hypothetical protein
MIGWKQDIGLSEDMELVKSYVPQQVKEAWKEEAKRQGVSLSKYVAAKVEQARATQAVSNNGSGNEEVEQLQQMIAELEEKLEEARANQAPARSTTVSILEDGVVTQRLSHRCKTLEEILRDLVEGQAVDRLIREPVETR